jgi:CRP-like cAMP-binding protein
VTCSGEAETLSGSVGIEFGDQDDEEEELSGTYRLDAEIYVRSGEARVYSYDADGERLPLGTVSAGSPLRVEGVLIDPFGESSVFFVDAGEGEVGGLRYEGRIEPA